MSESDLPVEVLNTVCPECKGKLLDYGQNEPYYWCLNYSDDKPCNTYKIPK